MNVLLIGGTGPTGGFIVDGLLDRGHAVTIMHGGQHEVSLTTGMFTPTVIRSNPTNSGKRPNDR